MKRIKLSAPLLAALGLALAAWVIGRLDVREIGHLIARVGVDGFALFVLSYLLMLAALGAAWAVATRDHAGRRLGLFTWARAVREAAGDLLPFSQVGGLLLGVRVLIRAGLPPTRVYAGTIVDLTTEIGSQALLVLAGVLAATMLLDDTATLAHLRGAAWLGLGFTGVGTILLVLLQRPLLRLASRAAARVLPAAAPVIDGVRGELDRFAARPAAMIPSFLCNAAAWLLAIVSAWLGLTLLDAHPEPARVLALEALIFALRSAAFVLPGGWGVQEASYAVLGPVFGIDSRVALALSLLKRARDVVVGLPTLLLYRRASSWFTIKAS